MEPILDSSKAAVVDSSLRYRPIGSNTPRGMKMILIRKDAGVAQIGTLWHNDTFFTHWFPLPRFPNGNE